MNINNEANLTRLGSWGKGYLAAKEAMRAELEWQRAEIERLNKILEAAKLYDAWERKTKDCPHDEQGCEAHEALLAAIRSYEAEQAK